MIGPRPGRYRVAAFVFACLLLVPLSGFGQGQGLHSFRSLWQNFPNLGEQARKEALSRISTAENEYYQTLDLAELYHQENLEGCNPYRIVSLDTDRYAVLLRGASQVLLIDPKGNVLDRGSTPASPTSMVYRSGTLLVGSESSPQLMRFVPLADRLGPGERFSISGVMGLRDLEITPEGRLFGCDEITNQVFEIPFPLQDGAGLEQSFSVAPGPIDLVFKNNYLYVNSLVSHEVHLLKLTSQGRLIDEGIRVKHDGPIWALKPIHLDGKDYLALGGAENTPLDRTLGFFGNIDSFLFLYEITAQKAQLVDELNLSALGLITPKWIGVSHDSPSTILVSGYGSPALLELDLSKATLQPKKQFISFPGVQEFTQQEDGTWMGVSPLLDGVVFVGNAAPRFASLQNSRDSLFVLGESLFFTKIMAPANSSLGKRSRFTCETCHFEGMVDGRIHFTGRGDVHAVTKPLRGLVNNKPYFSRALDPDLTTMVNNEFRVATSHSGLFPWFSLSTRDHPWLSIVLDQSDREIDPETLRRAMVYFFSNYQFPPNPYSETKTALDSKAKKGAELFAKRCETCHQARLAANDPASRISQENWEDYLLERKGPIVWGSERYERTGIEPYVHEKGARVPSLRRLHKKYPYFTNGSATSLNEVLSRFSWNEEKGAHFSTDPTHTFTPDERASLIAFLRLL